MRCQRCGTENGEGIIYCTSCGEKLSPGQPPETLECKSCGHAIQPGERYCSNCLTLSPRANSEKVSSASAVPQRHGILFWGLVLIGLIGILVVISIGFFTGAASIMDGIFVPAGTYPTTPCSLTIISAVQRYEMYPICYDYTFCSNPANRFTPENKIEVIVKNSGDIVQRGRISVRNTEWLTTYRYSPPIDPGEILPVEVLPLSHDAAITGIECY